MRRIILLLALPFLITYCQPPSERQAGKPGDSTQSPPKYNAREDCPRPTPKPILSKEAFPDRKFKLEHGMGYETVMMKGNDSLVIVHGGCEYINTSFRFYTNAPGNAAAKLMMHKKAVSVLDQIIRGLENPKAFIEGTEMLSGQIRKGTMQVGTEYEYGVFEPSGLSRTVMLKDIQTLPSGRLRVTVDFKEGPL